MPTPSSIITAVAALMNDSAQQYYTNTAVLPYFNLSLDELQELFELNSLPITNETTSLPITVPAGITSIGYNSTPPTPTDLIEIQQLWESPTGLNQWSPMTKKDFLPHNLENNTLVSYFGIWALLQGYITVIEANVDIDIKLDYTASMFATPILIGSISVNLPFINVKTYLEYKTAALCAMFIGENESRAMALDSLAGQALSRALGIPIKGMQAITTRRLPFRYAYKSRGSVL